MKNNIFILAGLAIAVAFTGCTKDFADPTPNPHQPAPLHPGQAPAPASEWGGDGGASRVEGRAGAEGAVGARAAG